MFQQLFFQNTQTQPDDYKTLNIEIPGVSREFYQVIKMPSDGNCLYGAVLYDLVTGYSGDQFRFALAQQITIYRQKVAAELSTLLISGFGNQPTILNETLQSILSKIDASHPLYLKMQHFPDYTNKTRPIKDYIKDIADGNALGSHFDIVLLEKILNKPITVILQDEKNKIKPMSLDAPNTLGTSSRIFIFYNQLHYDAIHINNSQHSQVYSQLQKQFSAAPPHSDSKILPPKKDETKDEKIIPIKPAELKVTEKKAEPQVNIPLLLRKNLPITDYHQWKGNPNNMLIYDDAKYHPFIGVNIDQTKEFYLREMDPAKIANEFKYVITRTNLLYSKISSELGVSVFPIKKYEQKRDLTSIHIINHYGFRSISTLEYDKCFLEGLLTSLDKNKDSNPQSVHNTELEKYQESLRNIISRDSIIDGFNSFSTGDLYVFLPKALEAYTLFMNCCKRYAEKKATNFSLYYLYLKSMANELAAYAHRINNPAMAVSCYKQLLFICYEENIKAQSNAQKPDWENFYYLICLLGQAISEIGGDYGKDLCRYALNIAKEKNYSGLHFYYLGLINAYLNTLVFKGGANDLRKELDDLIELADKSWQPPKNCTTVITEYPKSPVFELYRALYFVRSLEHRKSGSTADAILILNKASSVLRKCNYHPDHYFFALIQMSLGDAYCLAQEISKATTHYGNALEIFRKNINFYSPHQAMIYNQAAALHIQKKTYAFNIKDLNLLEAAFDIYAFNFGKEDVRDVNCYNNYATLCIKLGYYNEAYQYATFAAKIVALHYYQQEYHPEAVKSLETLGLLLLQLKDPDHRKQGLENLIKAREFYVTYNSTDAFANLISKDKAKACEKKLKNIIDKALAEDKELQKSTKPAGDTEMAISSVTTNSSSASATTSKKSALVENSVFAQRTQTNMQTTSAVATVSVNKMDTTNTVL